VLHEFLDFGSSANKVSSSGIWSTLLCD